MRNLFPQNINKGCCNIINLMACFNIDKLRRTETGTVVKNALTIRKNLNDKLGGKIRNLVMNQQTKLKHPDVANHLIDVDRIVKVNMVNGRLVNLTLAATGFKDNEGHLEYQYIPTTIEQHSIDLTSTIQTLLTQGQLVPREQFVFTREELFIGMDRLGNMMTSESLPEVNKYMLTDIEESNL